MTVLAEKLAAQAFRDWLLWKLPAKVVEVNAERFASIRAATPGPYTIPANATLGFSHTFNNAALTGFAVTAGSRTTAQMVTQINAAMGGTPASADADDRLLYTSPLAPTGTTPSKVWVRGGTSTDCNSVFGWDAGGEKEVLTALVAPGLKGVCNGLPQLPDFGPAGVVAVIIGNRSSKPTPGGPRRHQFAVAMDVDIIRIETQQQVNKTKEHIESAVRCVREVLLTTAGRQLGRARSGDIMLVEIGDVHVSGTTHKFLSKPPPANPNFEGAAMKLQIRVNETPDTA